MTRQVANTVVQTDTFAGWVEKTNELATHMRESVVTTVLDANTHVAGANTVGNGFVVGVFGANTFALLTDSNSDAFIRAIQNGESDSANSSGNIVFQSVTNFNANVFANNITVDIEGNVVSNGTNFSVTTSANTTIDVGDDYVITTSNTTHTANVGMSLISPAVTVDASDDLTITSSNTSHTANVGMSLSSPDLNIDASDDLTITSSNTSHTANVGMVFTSPDITLDASDDFVITATNTSITSNVGMAITTPDLVVTGNNVDLNSTYANVSGSDLYVTSNVTVEAANLTIGNGTSQGIVNVSTQDFNTSANVDVTGTDLNVSANSQIGGNVTINGGSLYSSANVEVEAANVTIGNATSTGLVNVATQDFNTSANVDITGSTLTVNAVASFGANVIVNANDFVVDTSNQRVGIGTATPSTMVHVIGPGAQTVTIEGGSANVLIVANSQSNFYGSQNVVIKTAGSKHIKLHANGTTGAAYTAMLAANGNFGIGNTAPAEKLVVAGEVRATANVTLQDALTVNNSITANTLTLNANGTLEDSLSVNNSITANTLTLNANGTLQDSLSVNNAIDANTVDIAQTLKVGGTINHANDVYTVVTTMTTNNDSDTKQDLVQFAHGTYQSAKITVSGRFVNASATEVQVTEALVVTDGIDVFMTTFGTLSTDATNDFSVFTIDAEREGANVHITVNHANTDVSNTKLIATSQLYRIQS